MALTYERVIRVISQSPDKRKDFEVNNLLPWFRKKSDLFRNLKTELLFDIIKNLQFATKERDDVIIRQGDKGECMYILLRGQVTIFIQYATSKTEDTDERPPKPKPEQTAPDQAAPTAPAPASAQEESELIRKRLGTYVCSLVPGATFGEVALLSEDCIRTASIIADERTDLIVVDRQLYNRSVKYVLQKEFEDKSTFIATNPLFRGWAPRYHKQLTMALQKDICGYEGVLVKQGAPVTAIYFILSGEVKVVMDPQQHKTQYPRFRDHFAKDDRILATSSDQNGLADTPDSDDHSPRVSREQTNGFVQFQYRRRPTKKQLVEVCLLGVNESVGDAEVLLDLDTYMQTVICTQKTDVLVLEMKHYERLLAKRNPRTIDKMMENLEVKLDSRLTKHLEQSLPLVGLLLDKARVHNIQRRRQRLARQLSRQDRRQQTGPTRKTMANSFDNFVPTHGALVDMYGPGTVFHHIRKREQAKAQKEQKRQQVRRFVSPQRAHN
ncbi:hypothetical protein NP493_877g00021 [Ridgeia piscesae]|uniref:Cyclic nucleotide-binding domain-containing protein n=1 Tax=Ridgeia piscesae TaxID=27915 RepID=A0AAD9KKU0_RIDPI|nr:hypothetical protein NP493_877g00021 [Ridgeia piscesae]